MAAGAGAQDCVPPEAQVVTGTSADWREARRWLEKQANKRNCHSLCAVSACTMTPSFQRRAFRTVPCFRVSFIALHPIAINPGPSTTVSCTRLLHTQAVGIDTGIKAVQGTAVDKKTTGTSVC